MHSGRAIQLVKLSVNRNGIRTASLDEWKFLSIFDYFGCHYYYLLVDNKSSVVIGSDMIWLILGFQNSCVIGLDQKYFFPLAGASKTVNSVSVVLAYRLHCFLIFSSSFFSSVGQFVFEHCVYEKLLISCIYLECSTVY